ncbi:DMT family transporter [Myxococcota bacterium]|nr:DMT family transporter [Myxococcota bacterium]
MARVGLRVHAALIFVQLTFATWAVFGKYALGHLEPLSLATLRVLGAIPLFLLLARALGGSLRVERRDLPRLAALGFTGVFANQLLYIFGLRLTTATNASIIQVAIPVFTSAIAAIFGVERIGAGKIAGVALAVGGALVMLDVSRLQLGGSTALGDLLVIGNALSYAIYMVLQRPLLERLPPITVTAWAYVLGGLPIVVVGAPTLAAQDPALVPALTWAAVAYIVIVPTTLNYVLISFAIKHSSAAMAATYITLQPLVATLIAALLLGERAGWRQAVGFVSIVLGLAVVTWAQGAARREARAT